MDEYTRVLIKSFSKPELIEIAHDIGIKNVPDQTSSQLVTAINDDLYLNGVPEWADLQNDATLSYLVSAGFCDGNGNLIDPTIEEVKPTTSEVKTDVVTEDAPKPPCFGFEDSRDPACQRCKIATICAQKREKKTPECYGVLFDKNDAQCQSCMVAYKCSKIPKK